MLRFIAVRDGTHVGNMCKYSARVLRLEYLGFIMTAVL